MLSNTKRVLVSLMSAPRKNITLTLGRVILAVIQCIAARVAQLDALETTVFGRPLEAQPEVSVSPSGNSRGENPDALQDRGLSLIASENAHLAEVELRRAWELNPTEERYVRNLSSFYINNRRYDKAQEIVQDYTTRQGENGLSCLLQGEVFFAQKEFAKAYQSLRRSLEFSSDNYRAHQLVGLIHVLAQRELDALEELRLAAQQNPHSAQTRFLLGRTYYRTGNYGQARDEFLACLKIQPSYPKATENLGLCFEALEEISSATQAYERAIQLEKDGKTPPSEDPYVEYALLLAKQADLRKSIGLLREGLRRNPKSARANFELGRVLFKAEQITEAERYLLASSILDPKFSRPHFFLGRIYLKMKRVKDAKMHFSLFQDLDKDIRNREARITR